MFENISEKMTGIFRKLAGNDKISLKNIEKAMDEIRQALLAADVNYRVVNEFLADVSHQALGEKVISAVNPSEMFISIVHQEMIKLLTAENQELNFSAKKLTTMMIVGLQGTGKTTNLAKIAAYLSEKKQRKVLMIAGDVVRPAAIEQLITLGQQIEVEVFSLGQAHSALKTVQAGLDYAKQGDFDTVLIDTAGRLHIDEALMQELVALKKLVKPEEILLTVDAMTGQDIIQVATSFHEQLAITGLIVTKLDGDARGGAVLSVKAVTGVPIKFTGVGEKLADLDLFYPDRMADRILGMGDIVSFVEKAQEKIDLAAAEKSAARLMEGKFDLEDMLIQLEQMNKMGSFMSVMKMIPGLNQLSKGIDGDAADETLKRNRAIIQSMTKEERQNPEILRASRKNRVATGSGTSLSEVNRLLKQYTQMKDQMRLISRMVKK